jgi:hypothetical protein
MDTVEGSRTSSTSCWKKKPPCHSKPSLVNSNTIYLNPAPAGFGLKLRHCNHTFNVVAVVAPDQPPLQSWLSAIHSFLLGSNEANMSLACKGYEQRHCGECLARLVLVRNFFFWDKWWVLHLFIKLEEGTYVQHKLHSHHHHQAFYSQAS